MFCWIWDPICDTVHSLSLIYTNIYEPLASSGLRFPMFAFASPLHYSCTYWFVKQPIKLDMEVGITLFNLTWRHNIPRDFFFFFLISEGMFNVFQTRTSRYMCNLREKKERNPPYLCVFFSLQYRLH